MSSSKSFIWCFILYIYRLCVGDKGFKKNCLHFFIVGDTILPLNSWWKNQGRESTDQKGWTETFRLAFVLYELSYNCRRFVYTFKFHQNPSWNSIFTSYIEIVETSVRESFTIHKFVAIKKNE